MDFQPLHWLEIQPSNDTITYYLGEGGVHTDTPIVQSLFLTFIQVGKISCANVFGCSYDVKTFVTLNHSLTQFKAERRLRIEVL